MCNVLDGFGVYGCHFINTPLVERKQSKPTSFKSNFVTRVSLLGGGFDTPSAVASGYSTTDVLT